MKKFLRNSIVFLFFISTVSANFSDIKIEDWQYKSVEYLTAKNIIQGYSDGSFQPQKNVNRVEALKLILAATEKDLQENPETPSKDFSDVPSGIWFETYVRFASSKNIVQGDAQTGLFSPAREVNKAEFIKMLLLAFDIDPSKFDLSSVNISDTPEGAWFTPYMKFAVKFNILKKDDNENVYPSKVLNRGETAQMIFNILKNGRGLNPQILLNIIEEKLILSVQNLEKGDLYTASTNASVSNDFSQILIEFLPENKIVQAADKIAKSLKSLIGAYIAGQNGLTDDVITASKQAWTWADESITLNPNQEIIAVEIKIFAESMAKKARAQKESE